MDYSACFRKFALNKMPIQAAYHMKASVKEPIITSWCTVYCMKKERNVHFRCSMCWILHGAFFILRLKYEMFSERHLDILS